MSQPTTRRTFKDYCLRRLGQPVIDINVADEQIEDRIDDALNYYRDFHYDGTERVLFRHQITANDITNTYVTLPENIQGVMRILRLNAAVNVTNLFNIRYQIHLNDLFDFTSTTYVPYVMAMRHIEQLEEIFVGEKLIRFNRHTNQLHIDMKWNSDVAVGDFIIVDGYQTVDAETYADVWQDPWLKRYATALIKKQWGENLSKFSGMNLPGGVQFNGQRILDEANDEIRMLEEKMNSDYSLPVADMMG